MHESKGSSSEYPSIKGQQYQHRSHHISSDATAVHSTEEFLYSLYQFRFAKMGLDAQFHVYTEPFAPEPPACPLTFCSENLLELALPLEAEGPVDEELPAEREDGHTDGSAKYMSDHFTPYPVTPAQRIGCRLTQGRQLQDELVRVHQGGLRGRQRTQRPNLGGDVLGHLADALRGRVGCVRVNSSADGHCLSQLAYRSAPASDGSLANSL
jgi:hypothetical protein